MTENRRVCNKLVNFISERPVGRSSVSGFQTKNGRESDKRDLYIESGHQKFQLETANATYLILLVLSVFRVGYILPNMYIKFQPKIFMHSKVIDI